MSEGTVEKKSCSLSSFLTQITNGNKVSFAGNNANVFTVFTAETHTPSTINRKISLANFATQGN